MSISYYLFTQEVLINLEPHFGRRATSGSLWDSTVVVASATSVQVVGKNVSIFYKKKCGLRPCNWVQNVPQSKSSITHCCWSYWVCPSIIYLLISRYLDTIWLLSYFLLKLTFLARKANNVQGHSLQLTLRCRHGHVNHTIVTSNGCWSYLCGECTCLQ